MSKYKPQNPDKYVSDITDIIWRSKWEYKFCLYCDFEPKVKKWAMENIKIPYNVMVNGIYVTKTYIPDFWLQVENTKNEIVEMIIEIKPQKELEEPIEPKNHTLKSLQNYEYMLKTYVKNLNKWESAEKYCNKRSIHFHVLTEKYFDDKQIKLF